MSHRPQMSQIAFAGALSVMVGCSASLVTQGRHANLDPKPGEDWGATGHDFGGHESGVEVIAYGPAADGPFGSRTLVATGHCDMHSMKLRYQALPPQSTVKLWDGWGRELFSLCLGKEGWPAVGFTPDGAHFVFATRNGVMYWNIKERTLHKQFSLERSSYVISDDCRLVAVMSDDDRPRRICVFNTESREEVCSLRLDGMDFRPVAFLNSGKRLGVRSHKRRNQLAVWDIESGARAREFDTDSLDGAFSPDGSRVAEATDEHAIRIWETEQGSIACVAGNHSSHVWTVVFSADGRLLASAGEGGGPLERFGEIKVWDAATGAELATIIDDSSWGVTALKFSPDGTELASGHNDGRIRFWKVPDAWRSAMVPPVEPVR